MANEVTFAISGAEQLAALGPEFEKNVKEELYATLELTLQEGKKILKKTISDSNAVASGGLLRSVTDNILSGYDWKLLGEVSFLPPADSYSLYADKGRGPGKMPPLDRIRAWTAIKGIDISLAYPIARSIGAKGTAVDEWNLYDRTPFMDEAASRIDAEAKRQYEKLAERLQKRLDDYARNYTSNT